MDSTSEDRAVLVWVATKGAQRWTRRCGCTWRVQCGVALPAMVGHIGRWAMQKSRARPVTPVLSSLRLRAVRLLSSTHRPSLPTVGRSDQAARDAACSPGPGPGPARDRVLEHPDRRQRRLAPEWSLSASQDQQRSSGPTACNVPSRAAALHGVVIFHSCAHSGASTSLATAISFLCHPSFSLPPLSLPPLRCHVDVRRNR